MKVVSNRLAALLLVLVLGVTACGDDSDSDPADDGAVTTVADDGEGAMDGSEENADDGEGAMDGSEENADDGEGAMDGSDDG